MDIIKKVLYDGAMSSFADIQVNSYESLVDFIYIGKSGMPFYNLFQKGGTIELFYNAIIPISMILALIYFFLHLYSEMQKSMETTIEQFAKIFLHFAFAWIVISHGYGLAVGAASFGDFVVDELKEATSVNVAGLTVSSSGSDFAAALEPQLAILRKSAKDKGLYLKSESEVASYWSSLSADAKAKIIAGGTIKSPIALAAVTSSEFDAYSEAQSVFDDADAGGYITMMIQSLIMNIISLVMFAVIMISIITRGINVAIYVALSPLAFANIFGEGGQSSGMKFIKKLLAVSFQGPVMFLILSLSKPIMNIISDGAGDGTTGAGAFLGSIAILLSGFVIIGLIKSSEKFANDLTS